MRGLRQAGRTGRPPKLSSAQLRDLERALKRGPEAFGFASGLWTAARVRDLIEYRTGVRYHEDHVWRILRKLNWTCQRPSGRALERDEQAIRHWKKYRMAAGLKKSPLRAAYDRLHRRKRTERAAASGADLGAARTDPGAAASLQLEGAVGGGRDHLVELLLPALSRRHPCHRGDRLPRPSAAPPAGQALGGLGRRCRSIGRGWSPSLSARSGAGSPSSGCRPTRRNSIRWNTSGATGNITSCPTSARAISPSSAIRLAARCAACAGAHPWCDPFGGKLICHYDMQES